MPEVGDKLRVADYSREVFLRKVSLLLRENAHVSGLHQVEALSLLGRLGRQNKDGAKMVTVRVDTKPAEAIP
jgi:hypothetical protein